MVSSDAMKNIPFFIIPSAEDNELTDFTPNKTYAKTYTDENGRIPKLHTHTSIVNVPKETLGFVKVGTYRVSQSIDHMPLVRSLFI